jgi:hypothetical protein
MLLLGDFLQFFDGDYVYPLTAAAFDLNCFLGYFANQVAALATFVAGFERWVAFCCFVIVVFLHRPSCTSKGSL